MSRRYRAKFNKNGLGKFSRPQRISEAFYDVSKGFMGLKEVLGGLRENFKSQGLSERFEGVSGDSG